ncbi:MAG: bifunctional enoyl-CoA hydratase/phosphate acetyltransferase [Acidobacteriota bacterium]
MYKNLDELVSSAQATGPVQIAVAAGHDPDVIEALKQARDLGLAEGIFVGNSDKIRALAGKVGLEVSDDQILHEADEAVAARKAIGLIREGKARLLMKGKISTATLVRAVLDKEAGLRTGRLLSQVIVFEVPGFKRLMLMTDAAINIAPSLEQKAEICRNAIEVAQAIGIEKPNLAALCALEFVNSEMPATIDAAGLTMMNRRGQLTGAYVEGPVALDVPLSRFAAERKSIDSPLVEKTDIFVAPDIEAANILYRAILYFAKGESGGVVIGAKVPLILLSRAETPETKIRSIAIAILVANRAPSR